MGWEMKTGSKFDDEMAFKSLIHAIQPDSIGQNEQL